MQQNAGELWAETQAQVQAQHTVYARMRTNAVFGEHDLLKCMDRHTFSLHQVGKMRNAFFAWIPGIIHTIRFIVWFPQPLQTSLHWCLHWLAILHP